MAALAADKVWAVTLVGDGLPIDFPMIASDTVYKGSFCCTESGTGYLRPIAASLTSPIFQGLAIEQKTNGTTAGATRCRIVRDFEVEVSSITGLSGGVADVDTDVYMSDDQTFTSASTDNVLVGTVSFYDADRSTYRVHCQAAALRSI